MTETIERDSMQYDAVIVGAGPAGLSAAVRLKQLAAAAGREVSVCVVEKGSEVGAHILSGAVADLKSLDELLPGWRESGVSLGQKVTEERVLLLTKQKSFRLPLTPNFCNHGNYIVSLGALCRMLAAEAENLGVEIYPGFAAAEVLYHADGSVKGIATGDMGRNKDGSAGGNFQPGMALLAQQTIFAEGCRGSLSQEVIGRFGLDSDSSPQSYGLGIKEVWEVPSENCRPGLVVHTAGWPLDSQTYGGGFVYHMEGNRIAVGMIVGLDYANPYLSPFEEFQRFKTHPDIRGFFEGGRRIAYGARALVEGGLQSLPELAFAGGVLAGDSAGFLNVARIKGIHAAVKSGMLAAEAVFAQLDELDGNGPQSGKTASDYGRLFRQSWLYEELYAARNFRPAFKWGLFPAMAYAALDQGLLKGRAPWTLKHNTSDHLSLKPAAQSRMPDYPKPDGKLTFNRTDSVFLANVSHEENQPVHLVLDNPATALDVNLKQYASPETRYCPAGVYEIIEEDGCARLQINAANCVHCKTCDIKDPTQNIRWVCPEGGSGPNYGTM